MILNSLSSYSCAKVKWVKWIFSKIWLWTELCYRGIPIECLTKANWIKLMIGKGSWKNHHFVPNIIKVIFIAFWRGKLTTSSQGRIDYFVEDLAITLSFQQNDIEYKKTTFYLPNQWWVKNWCDDFEFVIFLATLSND